MKKVVLVLIAAAALLASAAAQHDPKQKEQADPSKCPLHAQHTKAHASGDDFDAMNRRGNEGMGFDQAKTTHHFLTTDDGGIIDVKANSPDDQQSIAAIRQHFQHIARAFAAGDFSIPLFVHDQAPPGVDAMKKLKGEIEYRYEETAAGARVVITSKNKRAIAAVHDFLDFQIREHRTGDPVSAGMTRP